MQKDKTVGKVGLAEQRALAGTWGEKGELMFFGRWDSGRLQECPEVMQGHYLFMITVHEILEGKKFFLKNSQMTIKFAYKPH